MQGSIIRYDFQSGRGAISGDDGNRYSFSNAEWRENYPPAQDMRVDFDDRIDHDGQGRQATEIYAVDESRTTTTPSVATGSKSKVTAGILGILVGGIGIHKFYLGRTGLGILYLLLFWTFIPAIIGFIEGIIYLTKSDEEFERIYVQERKAWF